MLRSPLRVTPGRQRNRGSVAVPVIGAIGFFLVVIAVLYISLGRAKSSPAPVAKTPPASPAPAVKPIQAAKPAQPAPKQPLVMRDPLTQPAPVAPATVTPQELTALERIQSHLEAGEFGVVLAMVNDVNDPAEQTAILKLVAQAQMASGDFNSAMSTINRMPLPGERAKSMGELAQQESLAGGGVFADFSQLIQLIQTNTGGPPDGPWLDVDGDGGTLSQYNTGVRVDPNGMLATLTAQEQFNRLKNLGQEARVADINEDMAKPSALRMVSLTRLEKAVAERLANGQTVVSSMQHLAGLSRIQYVFVFPETGEIVIAGPAEGWKVNERGMTVGVTSERPVMHLDDLVTVLRTFSKDGLGIFTCSIVPRQEGLKSLKDFVEASNSRGPLNPAGVARWAQQMEDKLGQQDIVYEGIPIDSRVAQVIVEADYRMKLIGIGKLDGGENIPSFFDLLPNANSAHQLDALRWWLTMKYDSIQHSADRNVFEIQGSSVRCLSENELINDLGQRIQTGQTEETNRLFAQNFTSNYQELAKRDLVFADLQNVFDLALVAALIRDQRLDERAQWSLGSFAASGLYRPASLPVPRTVNSVVNYRKFAKGEIVAQVAGGVRADLMSVVRNDETFQEAPRLKRQPLPQLPEGRWWWDAATR